LPRPSFRPPQTAATPAIDTPAIDTPAIDTKGNGELMMLDHVTIGVTDVERSKIFYDRALRPLGIRCVHQGDGFAGFGSSGKAYFWIGLKHAPQTGVHIAFATEDRKSVDAFHAAALGAGGKDNGKPGLRAQYHPNYYGAFILDPDGHNIEAVCHLPSV
jgi:catechol 2,3-dioxygenase-like lactoylglutathione lyase family enzyme